MKLLLVALMAFPLIGFSQVIIKNSTTVGTENIIGTAKNQNVLVSKLTYDISGTDTMYTLTIMKGKNTFVADYQLLLFIGSKQLNGFYDALKSVLKGSDEQKIDVNGIPVTITTTKEKGTKYAVITTSEGASNISEKQLDQTFGIK